MRKYWLSWVVCGLAAVFYCYEYILRISPNAMSADLMVAFGISAAYLGNLSAFYYHAYSPMQLPVGLLIDKFKPRLIIVSAVLLCAIGTVLFVSNSYALACFGRALVGLGSAFAFVSVLKLTDIWLPEKYFAIVTGLTTSLGMLGAMMGNILMADLVQNVGWRQTLIYGAIFGFVVAPVMYLVIRNKPPKDHPMHSKSISHAEHNFSELIEHCKDILKNPQLWFIGLIGGLLYLPTSVFAELFGSAYFSTVHGFSTKEGVTASSMIFAGWAIGGPLMGYISDSVGRRKFLIQIGTILGAIVFGVVLLLPTITYTQACILMVLFGVFSSVEILVFVIGKENCPEILSGTAVSFVNFLVMIGGGLFQPIVGFILDYFGVAGVSNGVPYYAASSYNMALSIFPVGFGIAFLLATFCLKETYCKQVVK